MNDSVYIRKRFLALGFMLLLFLIAIPLAVFMTQSKAVVTSSAAEPQVCVMQSPQDIVLIFDTSSSMGYDDGTPSTRMEKAKAAGVYFADRFAELNSKLPSDQRYRISVVRFADYSYNTAAPATYDWPKWTRTVQGLTTDMNKVKKAINNLAWPSNFAFTCIECGLRQAYAQLQSSTRPKTVILLTDGVANWREGTKDLIWDPSDWGDVADWPFRPDHPVSEKAAEDIVKRHTDITLHTVGVARVNGDFLDRIRRLTPDGLYRYTRDGTGLRAIYTELIEKIQTAGQGAVTGTVFNDTNKNGVKDPGEEGLSGWEIVITNTSTGEKITVTTKADGTYTLDGLCDGEFEVSQEKPDSKWVQTSPVNPLFKTIIIEDGGTQRVNFGNYFEFSIQGTVFLDTNKNNIRDGDELPYSGRVSIIRNGVTYSNLPSTYSFTGLTEGNYSLRLVVPPGYIAYPPTPNTYNVRLDFPKDCTISPNSVTKALCTNDGITGLNFALKATGITETSWIQSQALDVRIDKGYSYPIPDGVSCPAGPYASIKMGSGTPGIIISGGKDAEFGAGKASAPPYNWIVGSDTYPEKYESTRALRLSYAQALNAIKQAGKSSTTLTSLNSCQNAQNCSLASIPDGTTQIYRNEGPLRIVAAASITSGSYVILVNGPVTIEKPIQVARGAFFMIISSDSLYIDSDLGTAPSCSPVSLLDGFYIADANFIVEGSKTCAQGGDLMLPAAGAVVVNARRTGGNFVVGRNLCDANAVYPAFRITPRLDMVLNFPDYLQTPKRIWQEIAP